MVPSVTSETVVVPKKAPNVVSEPAAMKEVKVEDVSVEIVTPDVVEVVVEKTRAIFSVSYDCQYGEDVYIVGDVAALGAGNSPVKMNFDGRKWKAARHIPTGVDVTYHYFVIRHGGHVEKEVGAEKVVNVPSGCGATQIHDEWQGTPTIANAVSDCAIFTDCIHARQAKKPLVAPSQPPSRREALVRFSVAVPWLPPSHEVRVVGNCPELGNWDADFGLPLADAACPVHTAWLRCPVSYKQKLEYKYILVHKDGADAGIMWEAENREFVLDTADSRVFFLSASNGFRYTGDARYRGAGVYVPLFSLRSAGSVGVGDFADIAPFADFCEASGFRLMQLLPINDTMATNDFHDSYPYRNISVFALHPLYAHLQTLPLPEGEMALIEAAQRRLEACDAVDYTGVMDFKMESLRRIHAHCLALAAEGASVLEGMDAYAQECAYWLPSYCAFKCLADKHGNVDFWTWPEECQNPSEAYIEELYATPDAKFHVWLQWVLDTQMREARSYAESHSVALKGDIPIGVSRASVDCWAFGGLFDLSKSVGAPPDAFSESGQNWGFPTYRWDVMSKDGFKWWKQRFSNMTRYFHCFRVDHILGWFRIWRNPIDACSHNGMRGQFEPAFGLPADTVRRHWGCWDIAKLTEPGMAYYMVDALLGEHKAIVEQHWIEVPSDADEARALDQRWNCVTFRLQKRDGVPVTEKMVQAELETMDMAPERRLSILKAFVNLMNNVVFNRQSPDPESPEYNLLHPRYMHGDTAAGEPCVPMVMEQLDGPLADKVWRHTMDYYSVDWEVNEAIWAQSALSKFHLLRDCKGDTGRRMLVVGEDLGHLSSCVPRIMRDYGVLGLRVQRMPPPNGGDVGHPSKQDTIYPYDTVCTPSTHDGPTVTGWFEAQSGRKVLDKVWADPYFLGNKGLAPAGPKGLDCDSTGRIIDMHMHSKCMFSVALLADYLDTCPHTRRPGAAHPAETINDPSNPDNYWNYRAHLTSEALCADRTLINSIRSRIKASGRLSYVNCD
ncbi:glycoside hydrolase, family 77 [Kipferlia bialata]|uniref:4-alpha-glucanotransferase n=1 Tax=Kipferlia bialata TaxID=797122 RepID=A0A9K3GKC5_9EUKA|nr:glycoside hydrolase, family 77 [Kipferlia bialata]|eukprot:g7152.t1